MRLLSRVLQLLLIAAALALSAVALGSAVGSTNQEVRSLIQPAVAQPKEQLFQVFSVCEQQFNRQVPRGSTVYIANVGDLWNQRIAEYASGWAIPVTSPAAAQYRVLAGPASGGCDDGLGFTVLRNG